LSSLITVYIYEQNRKKLIERETTREMKEKNIILVVVEV
jgi:hypothetical protein